MPIRFAQTIVEEPKYGASSREAAISVASEPMPAPNTSAAERKICRFFITDALDHDDGEVVRQLALGPIPARRERRFGDLPRRQRARSERSSVQPLDAVLLAAASRLDDAVRVGDDDRAGRERGVDRLVRLRRVDAERQAAREDPLDRAVRVHQPGCGMAAAAHATSPLAASITSSTIVMNLPGAMSEETTSFAAARNFPGSTCSRASERKTYFAIAMSAVASTPWPVTSPRTTARRPSSSVR